MNHSFYFFDFICARVCIIANNSITYRAKIILPLLSFEKGSCMIGEKNLSFEIFHLNFRTFC